MQRREFIGRSLGLFAASIIAGRQTLMANVGQGKILPEKSAPLLSGVNSPFKMKFSPRAAMGIFKTSCPGGTLDRIKFYYDNGFTAVEGCCSQNSDKKLMDAIGAAVEKYGLEMGAQSAMNEKYAPMMTANVVPAPKGKKPHLMGKAEIREYLKSELEKVFEMLRRIHGKTFIIGAGQNAEGLSEQEQYKNVLENIKFCADLCEKNGFTMLIEPLNLKSHPNIYFSTMQKGLEICKAVDNPHCKLMYDFFHEKMQTGSLDSLDTAWDYIGAYHISDSPTREEPGTGDIDYPALLSKIWNKGYRGFLGFEFKQSRQDKETDIKIMKTFREFDKLAV